MSENARQFIKPPDFSNDKESSDDDDDINDDSKSVGSTVEEGDVNESFKKNMAEYVSLENSIKELKSEITQRSKRLKQLQPLIITFMKKSKVEHCKLSNNNGIVEMKQRKSSSSLNRNSIQSLLTEFLKDADLAKKATDFIYENKQVKYVSYLKRSYD